MYSRLKGKVVVRVIYLMIMFYFKISILDDLLELRKVIPDIIAKLTQSI